MRQNQENHCFIEQEKHWTKNGALGNSTGNFFSNQTDLFLKHVVFCSSKMTRSNEVHDPEYLCRTFCRKDVCVVLNQKLFKCLSKSHPPFAFVMAHAPVKQIF